MGWTIKEYEANLIENSEIEMLKEFRALSRQEKLREIREIEEIVHYATSDTEFVQDW